MTELREISSTTPKNCKLLIETDCVETLRKICMVKYLNKESQPIIKEVIWLMSNIAARDSKDTEFLVQLGIVADLFDFLGVDDNDLIESTTLTLANIAGDYILDYRDQMLANGIASKLKGILKR